MKEDEAPLKPDELSEDDLAVLAAFDAMEDWTPDAAAFDTSVQKSDSDAATPTAEEMLLLFISEVEEDLSIVQLTLQRLEPDDFLDPARLLTIQRTAHKLKGTTGSMGYTVMYTIAYYIEALTKLLGTGTLSPFIGLNALLQSARAFEGTLNTFVATGNESTDTLLELETEYKTLAIDIPAPSNTGTLSGGQVTLPNLAIQPFPSEDGPVRVPLKDEDRTSAGLAGGEPEGTSGSLHVDIRRFEQLALHSEHLADLYAPLENAQAQVETALQNLHLAQTRLRRLETLFSSLSLSTKNARGLEDRAEQNEEYPVSSLVARILNEAQQRTGRPYQRKGRVSSSPGQLEMNRIWDAMEIDRYTESDTLALSFSEATADVATASSQLRAAFTQLQRVIQQYTAQVNNVRNDTLVLRLAPLNSLLARIERAVKMSAIAQDHAIAFEVTGEMVEVDQDILDVLTQPLLQLVRGCMTDSSLSSQEEKDMPYRTWFHAQVIGSEVHIEVGFSMLVHGGGLEEVQETITRLHGSINVQRNEAGGISFHLRIPRSQGTAQGLLVRVGSHRVMIPFSQVQSIYNGSNEMPETPDPPYLLNTLLGFPAQETTSSVPGPILQLHPRYGNEMIQVDEVLGEVELVVKPLVPHLRRPGIPGTAIDGMGQVLLLVDLPELLRHQHLLQQKQASLATTHKPQFTPTKKASTVLIADDSVSIRGTVQQTLCHAGYHVIQAREGMEALEVILNTADRPPDVLLLDVEMPNLNGYDLLNIIRTHPELAAMKIVMLTSRSSDKHRKRAEELGAHAYLTKPCPQDILLETIQSLLQT